MSASHPPNETAEQLPGAAFSRRQRILLALVPPVATTLIQALCLTLRFETKAEAGARPADRSDSPDIYAFWHRCLLLAAYRYRGLGVRILVSQSFDGELIARIVQRLGFVAVRGSSTRGGAAGLLTLSRALTQGNKVAITVDGPRGPACKVKPGIVFVALRQARANAKDRQGEESAEISPFHLHASRAWTLRSWDNFVVPKPFARVRCAWVTPVPVHPTDSIESISGVLQQSLDRAVALAELVQRTLD